MTDYEQIESSQRQHHNEMRHYDEMAGQFQRQQLMHISELKPGFTKDGDEYCFLYGSNLQEGVAGFGKSPFDAAADFYNNFHGIKPV
jgi:hypothetical protein